MRQLVEMAVNQMWYELPLPLRYIRAALAAGTRLCCSLETCPAHHLCSIVRALYSLRSLLLQVDVDVGEAASACKL